MPAETRLKRVAIIVHRVGPYHFARARAAGKKLDTTVIEMFKGDDIYKWDLVVGAESFERKTLFASQSESNGQQTHVLHSALDRCQPEAVAIPGWADGVAMGAMKWCRSRRVPAIVMSESTEWDEPRTFWKEWIKGRYLRMASAGFVGGRPHAEYLTKLGLSKEKVFKGYDAVDNEYFAAKADEVRGQTSEFRNRYQLPERYFLASARFVEKKNLVRLLQAYAQYREMALQKVDGIQHPASSIWKLVLLGDGPLKQTLNAQLSALSLNGLVLLPGFKQYHELPIYYGLASAFIHASTTEQWGLVVNEAMASGVPVLVSNRCGCAVDLVQEGVNGFCFDPEHVGQIAHQMLKIANSSQLSQPGREQQGAVSANSDSATSNQQPATSAAQMGAASRHIIAKWGPERFAEGLEQAVEMALSALPPKVGALDQWLLKMLQTR